MMHLYIATTDVFSVNVCGDFTSLGNLSTSYFFAGLIRLETFRQFLDRSIKSTASWLREEKRGEEVHGIWLYLARAIRIYTWLSPRRKPKLLSIPLSFFLSFCSFSYNEKDRLRTLPHLTAPFLTAPLPTISCKVERGRDLRWDSISYSFPYMT